MSSQMLSLKNLHLISPSPAHSDNAHRNYIVLQMFEERLQPRRHDSYNKSQNVFPQIMPAADPLSSSCCAAK